MPQENLNAFGLRLFDLKRKRDYITGVIREHKRNPDYTASGAEGRRFREETSNAETDLFYVDEEIKALEEAIKKHSPPDAALQEQPDSEQDSNVKREKTGRELRIEISRKHGLNSRKNLANLSVLRAAYVDFKAAGVPVPIDKKMGEPHVENWDQAIEVLDQITTGDENMAALDPLNQTLRSESSKK
jgi:hypothetical protein